MKLPQTNGSPLAEPSELSSVRDRLLDTAADLFYREGIRAIGVDLVVERSGVAKTSLYRHFRSKDELITAVLERDDHNYWANWDRVALRQGKTPNSELTAQMKWIAQYIGRPEFRGCAFLNAATEFPAADHPARKIALRHKQELRSRLVALTQRLAIPHAKELADQLVLLIDGAYVNGQLYGKHSFAQLLPKAAAVLIDAATSMA
jgi:AcrR family transcriptional regulator